MSASADDQYEQQNDQVSGDVPAGDAADNDYVNRPGQSGPVPVQKDDAPIDDPIDPDTADSDETLSMLNHPVTSNSSLTTLLEADDTEAIDKSNIIDERTRGASKTGQYREPGDEEGLPTDDGTSSSA